MSEEKVSIAVQYALLNPQFTVDVVTIEGYPPMVAIGHLHPAIGPIFSIISVKRAEGICAGLKAAISEVTGQMTTSEARH